MLCDTGGKKPPVFCKKDCGKMMDGEGNEKRREYIYGVVQMRHKYDCAKKKGGGNKEYAHRELIPEDQGKEKGESGMGREKQIAAWGEISDKIRRRDYDMCREGC